MAVARSQVSGTLSAATPAGSFDRRVRPDPREPHQQQCRQEQRVRLRHHPAGPQRGRLVNGHLQPTVAGVFDNVIRQNIVDGNGTKGFGAGIGMFGPFPGTAVYNNTIEQNVAEGNGLGGVAFHAHNLMPGMQYMSGNRVIQNSFGKNNVAGDQLDTDFPGSNPPGALTATSAVVIYSASTSVSITIARNLISNNTNGIWTTNVVSVSGVATNAFLNVKHPFVSVDPGPPIPRCSYIAESAQGARERHLAPVLAVVQFHDA